MQKSFIFAVVLLVASACGFTAKDMSLAEKRVDVEWMFGVFERNYAPAQWKQEKHGISLEKAKENCLSMVETVNGDDFYATMQKCTAQFKDAHTKALAVAQLLPEFTEIYYLGFTTEYLKAPLPVPNAPSGAPIPISPVLRVESLLPSVDPASFPVRAKDLIVKINGLPVDEHLAQEFFEFKDLGQKNASLVAAGAEFAFRTGYASVIPKAENVVLSIFRGGVLVDVQLPWVKKDLVQFSKEQEDARNRLKPKTASTESQNAEAKASPYPWQRTDFGYWIGSDFIDEVSELMNLYRKSPGNRSRLLLSSTFKVFSRNDALALLDDLSAQDSQKSLSDPTDFDAAATAASMSVVDLSKAPFVARLVLRPDGSKVGYIKVGTFEVDDSMVETFKNLVLKMNEMKVSSLIVDMLDNGGGSIVHGLRMVNLLSEKNLNYPSIQLSLNDQWLNSFKADFYSGPNDASREMAGRVYRKLSEDVKNNQRLSRKISLTELDVFPLTADKTGCLARGECLSSKVKLTFLINEMCASTCDIVASMVRDNALGTLIGSQSMGAGGNVVVHMMAPISRMMLSQTESLIVDVNGNYLENQGVIPDVQVDTMIDKFLDYRLTYLQALGN
jgi:hypothetical protein